MQKDYNPKKRSTRGTCVGGKLGYVFVLDLEAHSPKITLKKP